MSKRFDRWGHEAMTRAKLTRRIARPLRDFLGGLVLFGTLIAPGLMGPPQTGTGWLSNAAHARYDILDPAYDIIEATMMAPIPPEWVSFQPQLAAMLSLAAAFAALFAFNMWFLRHVKRVHASNRRRR